MGTVTKLKRGDLREALVDYALQATKDGHIEVMSLRQAARDLGVSSGAVYRHFPDKDTLFFEIVKIGFLDLRTRFLAVRPEGKPATTKTEGLRRAVALGHTYIRFAHENVALWHMMFGRIGLMCREELMQDDDLRRYTPFDVCVGVVTDLWNLGLLDHEPDFQDVRYLWSATHGAADLALSGARLDGEELDLVIRETVWRNMKALGMAPDNLAELNDINLGLASLP